LLISRKIFLSHKHGDKPRVRDFAATLRTIGLDPWFDEHDMPASAELERRLLAGIKESAVVVFFVTPDFRDETYIGAEINYAVEERRRRGDSFAIVTLVFSNSAGAKGTVPGLLSPYVWKEPQTDLEALRFIVEALPKEFGVPEWRSLHDGCSYIRVAVEGAPSANSASRPAIRVQAFNLSSETIYLRGPIEVEVGSDRSVRTLKFDARGRELLGGELRPKASLAIEIAADDLTPFMKSIGRIYFVDAMNRRYFSDERSPYDALRELVGEDPEMFTNSQANAGDLPTAQ
jgi:hypothetical protein